MKMEEASLIVVNCVRVTTNFSGTMKAQDTLQTLGVTNAVRVSGLRNRIVNDPDIGVPGVNHTLDPAFLASLSSDMTLIRLILIVFNNAVTDNQRPAVERAERALESVQKRESKNG
jgi:hypothetical protein